MHTEQFREQRCENTNKFWQRSELKKDRNVIITTPGLVCAEIIFLTCSLSELRYSIVLEILVLSQCKDLHSQYNVMPASDTYNYTFMDKNRWQMAKYISPFMIYCMQLNFKVLDSARGEAFLVTRLAVMPLKYFTIRAITNLAE